MPNEYANKVIVNNRTLIDLTGDTVTADKLMQGITAHDRSGAPITGTHDDLTAEPLSVTENGTYTAPAGKAYSPVTVNVSGGGGGDEPEYLRFTSLQNGVEISMEAVGNAPTLDLETSPDGTNWTAFYVGQTTIMLDRDDKIYFRGDNNSTASSDADYNVFVIANGLVMAGGNAISLLDKNMELTAVSAFAFARLFQNCANLLTAPELPATTLADSCCRLMFGGCTGLVAAPELPATTLADSCYYAMFQNCANLLTAPEMPATTLADSCYQNMFYGCTSLVTPPELPATTLADGCYRAMFYDCASLVAVPELPATTLADSCYRSMFNGCASLVTPPELPATTLADSCYYAMFNGCAGLVTPPELPATTLAGSCYQNMFYGCASLVTVPELPATTLADSCYRAMFYGCSKIKLSSTSSDTYTIPYRIPTSGTGTTATSALTNMFTNTGGSFKSTPTINKTYYMAPAPTTMAMSPGDRTATNDDIANALQGVM